MKSYWRTQARAVIQRTLTACRAEGLDEAATRQRLSAAYPFGPRQNHPYRVWRDEIRRAFRNPPPPVEVTRPEPEPLETLPLFARKPEEE